MLKIASLGNISIHLNSPWHSPVQAWWSSVWWRAWWGVRSPPVTRWTRAGSTPSRWTSWTMSRTKRSVRWSARRGRRQYIESFWYDPSWGHCRVQDLDLGWREHSRLVTEYNELDLAFSIEQYNKIKSSSNRRLEPAGSLDQLENLKRPSVRARNKF